MPAADGVRLPLLPRPRSVRVSGRAIGSAAEADPRDGFGGTTTSCREARTTDLPAQGYRLSMGVDGDVTMEARDDAGAFYGRATLAQLRTVYGDGLPVGVIEDWPDIPVRGVMLDVSRTKVPTLETLFSIVDRLAGWKVNQLQLYMEHTYAYADHEVVWAHADAYGPGDMEQLVAHCAERHVELVANQNTLGHMDRWLIHERYAPLGIARGVAISPFGLPFPASTLDPANPDAFSLVRELLGELGRSVPAARFHVGLDEPWELSADRKYEYLNWLSALRALRELDGREMLVWGDFLAAHPALLDQIGDGVTVCDWGYEANHPFEERATTLASAGVAHWTSPGTSSWMSILGRVSNAVDNCRAAAAAALGSGASGMLVTDWGDFGHLQFPPVSDPGLAAAASFAWCLSSNAGLDAREITSLLDLHCYGAFPADRARTGGGLGEALCLLGDVHTMVPTQMPNMSSLVSHLYLPQLPVGEGLTAGLCGEDLERIEGVLEESRLVLQESKPVDEHVAFGVEELGWSVELVKLLCRDARQRLSGKGMIGDIPEPARLKLAAELAELLPEYRRLWLRRNRGGGLDESCAWLEHLRSCYLAGEADASWAGPFLEEVRSRVSGRSG